MTPLESWLKETREVCEKANAGDGFQTEDSLKALCNDVGLITNPSLHIAAQVASETLALRTALPVALEVIEIAQTALEVYALTNETFSEYGDAAREALAAIDALLAKTNPPTEAKG